MEDKKTIKECAAELGCLFDEVKDAIKSLGIRQNVTVQVKLSDSEFALLKQHIGKKNKPATVAPKQEAPAIIPPAKPAPAKPLDSPKKDNTKDAKTAKKNVATTDTQKRRVGTIQVTEKKKRQFKRDRPKFLTPDKPTDKPATKEPVIEPLPAPEPTEIKSLTPPPPPPQPEPVKPAPAKPEPVKPQPDKHQPAKPKPAEQPQPAPPKATPPPVPAPAPPAPPTKVTLSGEELVNQQIKKQNEQKAAASTPPPPPTPKPTKSKPSPKPDKAVIKIDTRAKDKHRKRREKEKGKRARTLTDNQGFTKPTAPEVHEVKIPEYLSVSDLAQALKMKGHLVIQKLREYGVEVAAANEMLAKDIAWIVVEELGHKPVEAPKDDEKETKLTEINIDEAVYEKCAPVITVMGHVDHGKTSFLDYIRQASIADSEAGGITQHIGAYRVNTKFGPVSFIDTPGHALFTEMRSRGAKITNIVVLVVAADDGVKPQTIEAINHAKAANVPIVVAINKMDKPEANIDNVKTALSQNGVIAEDWGGDAITIPISAKTGQGVEELLDALALQADVLEIKAPINVPAVGTVIESRVEKGRGIIATVIVSRGVLKVGDFYLCGADIGRIRAMWDSLTPKMKEARPSMTVEIQGLSAVPAAGEQLIVVKDEKAAKHVAATREGKMREKRLAKTANRPSLASGEDALINAMADNSNEKKTFNVVVKTDVEGTREAVTYALNKIDGKNANVKVIHSGVGTVTESDIYLAQTGGGVVVAFNVRPDSRVKKIAESRGTKIILGNVIYELVEKVTNAVLDTLPPIIEEKVTGIARVQQVFSIGKVGQVAGCRVEEGIVTAKALVKLIRDNISIYEGRIASLKHFKDEATEVRVGSECGISIARFNDIKAGDTIEIIERTETSSEL